MAGIGDVPTRTDLEDLNRELIHQTRLTGSPSSSPSQDVHSLAKTDLSRYHQLSPPDDYKYGGATFSNPSEDIDSQKIPGFQRQLSADWNRVDSTSRDINISMETDSISSTQDIDFSMRNIASSESQSPTQSQPAGSPIDKVSTSSQEFQKPQNKSLMKKNKICNVCGDFALGYNFGAVSCESCKAFFRRNAFKNIRGRCDGTCEVVVETRSFCKKCRLQKCFTVGMRAHMILSDTQKLERRQKILENKLRRDKDLLPEEHNELKQITEALIKRANEPQIETPIKREPPSVECVTVTPPVPSMTPVDHEILKEISIAYKTAVEECPPWSQLGNPSEVEFVNLADRMIRMHIVMAKKMRTFKELSQEDQIALLKGCSVEWLILHSSSTYDTTSGGWKVPNSSTEVAPDELNRTDNQELADVYRGYLQFAQRLNSVNEGDEKIIHLLMILSLFSSDRGGLSAPEKINDLQEKYASALHHYVTDTFPDKPGKFAKCISLLAQIRELNEHHSKMMLTMNPNEIEPLLLEIFDIKSKK
ncbi:unnamed protein product [Owenia fusiformis]|uniref:Uncharacterized protein n=1 Tax=Owenia fusiformis TaxID=6347 RepID=A0A8J1XTG8_OWEFU|nr:unnamed protein product [Owenia fusiformis]